MGNNFLGTIAVLIISVIIYIIASGSESLSKQEKFISAAWVLLLLFLCAKLL